MDLKKIIILGSVGNCIDILDTINEINLDKPKYECIGFLDDNEALWESTVYGIKVLGGLNDAVKYKDAHFVNGIGSPNNYFKKEKVIEKTGVELRRFETIIHPNASVSKMSSLGYGCVIMQNVTITSNVRIGNHVMILPGSVINHDDEIEDYSIIASGVCIAGGVKVGKSCYLGSNSSIIGNINIGNGSLVGMGSVVLNDVDDNSVVIGAPARYLRSAK